MRDLRILLCCILFAVSCASDHPTSGFIPAAPHDKIQTFPYHVEEVYNVFLNMLKSDPKTDLAEAVPELFTIVTLSIPLDPESDIAKKVLFREDGEKLIGGAKYDIAATMKPLDEKRTQMQLDIHIDKYVRNYISYFKWREQPTNGVIEKMYFDRLRQELKAP